MKPNGGSNYTDFLSPRSMKMTELHNFHTELQNLGDRSSWIIQMNQREIVIQR